MYVKAVKEGKRGEAGFKPEVHQTVTTELAKEFPGIDFTVAKVKSKFNQTFKKVWDAFIACKGASGFGWNEAECMVTASEEVWNAFLVNTPFPKYSEYQVIFEGNSATGALRRSSNNTRVEPEEVQEADGNGHLDSSQTPAQRPGVRAPRQHRVTSGNRFENSIDRIVDAFVSSNQDLETNPPEASAIHKAIEKFQDHFATDLGMDKLVAGFGVLENKAKAKIFLAI
ncbi:hypothetical protein PGT21_029752 [Puccinia graminis f. sp. tritici]|uniref:Myb/SANT-like domain-containing protein n=1 Tax=Puccinia graminis f. sp. tritici TaxID=56615 RepID=A0A5B0Q6S8_PUCGR|nr:hypothetical protein PGT21_029752 [Puccinia graminis f. sp. tritici]